MLLTLLVGTVGCDEDRAFYIVQNQIPGADCVIGTEDSLYRSEGLLDVSLGLGYRLFPLLRNELPPTKPAGTPDPKPDRHLLQLREYRVNVDLGGIGESISAAQLSFTRPTSGTMPPGEQRASSVEIVPASVIRQLEVAKGASPTVIAEVVAIAETGDGERMESLPFFYPVTLCNGCLVVNLPSCPSATEMTAYPSNVCGLPQDEQLVCCRDELGQTRCLAGDE